MFRFQEGSVIREPRKSSPDVWVFRYYDEAAGKRRYRREIIGTVKEFPTKSKLQPAIAELRERINRADRTPRTVAELKDHFIEHELHRDAFSTQENRLVLLNGYIVPKWGKLRLHQVDTVEVEAWLSGLPLAPGSKTKIKSVFAVLFRHAKRHRWIKYNPISDVRTSSQRMREPDVLTPEEFRRILARLSTRDRAMVAVAGVMGFRRSEVIGLTWNDLDTDAMQVTVKRGCVRNRVGHPKTDASKRPVPLSPLVLDALLEWEKESLYVAGDNFIFASPRMKGERPFTPDTILKRHIRPAATAAGIVGKTIGWHSFRHSLATNLVEMDEDVKTVQELMRHASSRTTLDVYARANSRKKQKANGRIAFRLMDEGQNGSAPIQHLEKEDGSGEHAANA